MNYGSNWWNAEYVLILLHFTMNHYDLYNLNFYENVILICSKFKYNHVRQNKWNILTKQMLLIYLHKYCITACKHSCGDQS